MGEVILSVSISEASGLPRVCNSIFPSSLCILSHHKLARKVLTHIVSQPVQSVLQRVTLNLHDTGFLTSSELPKVNALKCLP